MKFNVSVQVEIRDKNGNLVLKTKKKLCKSYVKQMAQSLRASMAQAATATLDTSGVSRNGTFVFTANAGAGASAYGIQVGTGTNSVTINDYKLQTQIAHGTGATQLQYGAMTIQDPLIAGSTCKFTMARTFTNASGSDINVKEIGLVVYSTYYYMIERSLLDTVIANGESGTVTYTISVTV